jgi:hypothetical protein
MLTNLEFKKEVFAAFILFLATLIFSIINFSPVSIKPNFFLASLVVASLLFESFYVYFGFLFALLLWMKFTPNFLIEYFLFFTIGVVLFGLVKLFVFSKVRIVRFFLVFIFQLIFWFFMQAGASVFSIIFLLELMYNIVAVELFYILVLWIKKISF